MTPDIFLSATAFALVGSFTPGPNNAMLLTSGVNFGFRRTLPHIGGVTIGYGVMFAAVTLGLGRVFMVQPALYTALKIVGSLYMLWLAWRIATASGLSDGVAGTKPLTFLEAALFQWINPKGVMMAVAASVNFINPNSITADLAAMLALIGVMSLASASTWTLFGQGLRRFLADARRLTLFNRIMALALVASLWPLISAHTA